MAYTVWRLLVEGEGARPHMVLDSEYEKQKKHKIKPPFHLGLPITHLLIGKSIT